MSMSMEGKSVMVTGAAQGIGLACAKAFAEYGAKVALCDIDADQVTAAAGQLPGNALGLVCDVSKRSDVDRAIKETADRFGGLDVAISNAGIVAPGDVLEISEEDYDRVIGVNLKGGFLVGQAAAKKMVEVGAQGSIIFMSSVNAVLAIANQVPYAVSKGGLSQLTKVMALGLAKHNIRVNAIGPGSIETEILKSVMQDEAARTMILSRTPMGRVGTPDEVANVALFLASDYASYLTGQTIYPDGGRMSLNYVVPVET